GSPLWLRLLDAQRLRLGLQALHQLGEVPRLRRFSGDAKYGATGGLLRELEIQLRPALLPAGGAGPVFECVGRSGLLRVRSWQTAAHGALQRLLSAVVDPRLQ